MSNAFVTITQNVNLEYGDNVFYVKVTSETSKELEYELHIYRKPIDASVKDVYKRQLHQNRSLDKT